jgi:hypothetical protein
MREHPQGDLLCRVCLKEPVAPILNEHSRHAIREHSSARHEGDENKVMHDEDGRTNNCALMGVAIEPVHHEGYGFGRKRERGEHRRLWIQRSVHHLTQSGPVWVWVATIPHGRASNVRD